MPALARQVKPGVPSRVQVPVGEGVAAHPVSRVAFAAEQERDSSVNNPDEAYTEHCAGRRGDRDSLNGEIAPKGLFQSARVVTHTEANTRASVRSMVIATRARTAETPTQPSTDLGGETVYGSRYTGTDRGNADTAKRGPTGWKGKDVKDWRSSL